MDSKQMRLVSDNKVVRWENNWEDMLLKKMSDVMSLTKAGDRCYAASLMTLASPNPTLLNSQIVNHYFFKPWSRILFEEFAASLPSSCLHAILSSQLSYYRPLPNKSFILNDL